MTHTSRINTNRLIVRRFDTQNHAARWWCYLNSWIFSSDLALIWWSYSNIFHQCLWEFYSTIVLWHQIMLNSWLDRKSGLRKKLLYSYLWLFRPITLSLLVLVYIISIVTKSWNASFCAIANEALNFHPFRYDTSI